jgi:hypothetical protein
LNGVVLVHHQGGTVTDKDFTRRQLELMIENPNTISTFVYYHDAVAFALRLMDREQAHAATELEAMERGDTWKKRAAQEGLHTMTLMTELAAARKRTAGGVIT